MNNKELKSYADLVDIVKHDHTINFIATAVTQWNAISIDALLFFLQSKGYKINAAIVIAEHFKSGFLIDESHFSNDCSIYYHLPYSATRSNHVDETAKGFVEKFKSLLKYYGIVFSFPKVSINRELLFFATFNNSVPDAVIINKIGSVGRSIVVCQTEEGLGPYLGTFDKTYPTFGDVHGLKEIHGYFHTIFWGREFYRWAHTTYSSLTLKKTNKGLVVNETIIPFYRKVFLLRNKTVNPPIDKGLMHNSIILCSASWYRDEIIDDEDFRVMRNVCDNLYHRGFHLFLKPHPRDNFFTTKVKELHCELLDIPGLTLESICEFAQPRAVIGFPSATLVNPKIFWNIPTYCIADMINKDKINNRYQIEIERFGKTFKNIVSFVKTPDDIL